jgi:hypothetical protein
MEGMVRVIMMMGLKFEIYFKDSNLIIIAAK